MNNYKILGIKKNASKDEIIKSYKMHYLRYKNLGSNKTKEQEEAFKKIEKAYNELMGYNIHIENLSEKEQKAIFRFLKIDQEKFENFWMYNKAKIYAAIFIAILVFFFISQLANRPHYDINIVFAGDFKMVDETGTDAYFNTELVNVDVKMRFDFINESIVSYYRQDFYSDKSQIYTNRAAQQKFVVELANGVIDVLILDKSTFDYYVSKGFIMDIADFSQESGIDEDKRVSAVFVDNKDNKFETVYGIDVLNTEFIKDNGIVSADGEVIACIAANSKKADNAKKILQSIASKPAATNQSDSTNQPATTN